MAPTIPCPVGIPSASRTSDIEVVATGFGVGRLMPPEPWSISSLPVLQSFGGIEKNPSFEILSMLPNSIDDETGNGPNILVRKYPEPVKVSYRGVARLLPELYSMFPNLRYFVHIGVHGHICRCRLERKAKKGPYTKPDVDGRHLKDGFEDEDGVWASGPDVLDSQVDVDAIVERMMTAG